jgi:mRNA interferase MazF
LKRGEVWLVDFGSHSGLERAGQRPAIILQDDVCTSVLTTVVVLPLTTNLKRLSLPTTLFIPAGEGGLLNDSVALCHQVQVRGKMRLVNRLGELSGERLSEVQDCLLTTLGM